jgi:hypothetical protein
MFIRILGILLFLSFGSCSRPENLTKKDKETIIQNINQTLSNYYKDIKEKGLTAEFNYLDHSEDFFWVPPGFKSAISYDSVVIILKSTAPKFSLIDNRFDTLTIVPLSKTLAAYTGKIRSVMKDTSGQEKTYLLLETGIMIKRENTWKILNGQTAMIND